MDKLETSIKLRTYRKYKFDNSIEPYLNMFISRSNRAFFSQLRLGVLPIRIETGRYQNERLEERVCMVCRQNDVEDEFHFVMKCPHYNTPRRELFDKVVTLCPIFYHLNNQEKFIMLMREFPRQMAKYTFIAYMMRRKMLFK